MTIEALGQVVSSVTGGLALLVSIYTYLRSVNYQHYAELDRGYADLLAMAIERPFLRRPGALATEDERMAYDAYAYMVWNFLETVCDRCRWNLFLRRTWYPVIDAENRIHRAWFDAPENHHKFKKPFRSLILRKLPVGTA